MCYCSLLRNVNGRWIVPQQCICNIRRPVEGFDRLPYRLLISKLDSRLLCNAKGASRLAKRYYILIGALELTLQGQPMSNVVVQITQ